MCEVKIARWDRIDVIDHKKDELKKSADKEQGDLRSLAKTKEKNREGNQSGNRKITNEINVRLEKSFDKSALCHCQSHRDSQDKREKKGSEHAKNRDANVRHKLLMDEEVHRCLPDMQRGWEEERIDKRHPCHPPPHEEQKKQRGKKRPVHSLLLFHNFGLEHSDNCVGEVIIRFEAYRGLIICFQNVSDKIKGRIDIMLRRLVKETLVLLKVKPSDS